MNTTTIKFLLTLAVAFLQTNLALAHSEEYCEREGREHYICVEGYVYGPGGLEKWTGTSCDKVDMIVWGRFACVQGHVYGPGGLEKWTGTTCDKVDIVIRGRFACLEGHLYGPRGLKKWLGSCEKFRYDAI